MASIPVRFIYVTSAELNTVDYVDGQIIALTDQSGYYYDMGGERRHVSGGTVDVSAVPFAVTTQYSTPSALVCSNVTEITSLSSGTCLYVINSRNSVVNAFTLNVNNLGAKYVYLQNGERATSFPVDGGALFVYNSTRVAGGCWDMIYNRSYTLQDFGQVSVECLTDSTNSAKKAGSSGRTTHPIEAGAVVTVKFLHDVTGPATLDVDNTADYPIVYQGSPLIGNEITAGASAVFMFDGTQYILLGTDTLLSDVRSLQSAATDTGLFWATYNVTSFADIVAARSANKLVALIRNGVTYIVATADNTTIVFAPIPYRSNLTLLNCTASGWSLSSLALATTAQVNVKYTKPVRGIPRTDLDFVPAEIDKTFLRSDYAAESLLSGQRFEQLEYMSKLNLYTSSYIELAGSDFTENYIDPSSGLTVSAPGYYQIVATYPYNADLFMLLDDETYNWAVWADRYATPGSGMTHTATVSGWVSANVPLFLEHTSSDWYCNITICRKDGATITSSEKDYIAETLSIRTASGRGPSPEPEDTVIEPTAEMLASRSITVKNNPLAVDQIITVAATYYSGRDDTHLEESILDPEQTVSMYNMNYGASKTLLTNNPNGDYTHDIDCSTYIGLVLRGIHYQDTTYYTLQPHPPSYWKANPIYPWAVDLGYYSNWVNKGGANTPVVRASQLAKFFYDSGRIVPMDDKLINLEPGDILFYAKKEVVDEASQTLDWLRPNRFMHISHVGICFEKVPGSTISGWDTSRFPYRHRMYNVTSINKYAPYGQSGPEYYAPCVYKSVVERDWDNTDWDVTTHNNYQTLCLIARPDLGSITQPIPSNTKDSPFASGYPGQIMFDDNTLYICVANNTWKKVSLTSI